MGLVILFMHTHACMCAQECKFMALLGALKLQQKQTQPSNPIICCLLLMYIASGTNTWADINFQFTTNSPAEKHISLKYTTISYINSLSHSVPLTFTLSHTLSLYFSSKIVYSNYVEHYT